MKLAVFISGGGTTLHNLIKQQENGQLDVEFKLVISSRSDAAGLTYAEAANIPQHIVSRPDYASAENYRDAMFERCREAKVDYVLMGGFIQHVLIPTDFTHRVLNIHPSLIPAFCGKGYYGSHVHRAVLDYGAKVSGCTVHFVDDQYDHGPILLQRVVDGRTKRYPPKPWLSGSSAPSVKPTRRRSDCFNPARSASKDALSLGESAGNRPLRKSGLPHATRHESPGESLACHAANRRSPGGPPGAERCHGAAMRAEPPTSESRGCASDLDRTAPEGRPTRRGGAHHRMLKIFCRASDPRELRSAFQNRPSSRVASADLPRRRRRASNRSIRQYLACL